MEANRNITLGRQIALSPPYSFARGIAGNISGNIAFSVIRTGNIVYRVQSAPHNRALEIELSRGVLSSDTFREGLEVDIDPSDNCVE